jgi:hypothetical protein
MKDLPQELQLDLSRKHVYSGVTDRLGDVIKWKPQNIRLYGPHLR